MQLVAAGAVAGPLLQRPSGLPSPAALRRRASRWPRGRAQVVAESLVGQADFAGIELLVEAVEDHRQSGSSVVVLWRNERELEALRERVSALQRLSICRSLRASEG
jgi:hypothetical protein